MTLELVGWVEGWVWVEQTFTVNSVEHTLKGLTTAILLLCPWQLHEGSNLHASNLPSIAGTPQSYSCLFWQQKLVDSVVTNSYRRGIRGVRLCHVSWLPSIVAYLLFWSPVLKHIHWKPSFSSIKDFITVYKVQNILLAQLDYLSMSILISGCSEVIKISPNFILVNSVEHFKQSLVFFNWQSSCSCKCMNVGNITCLFGGFSNSCKCTTQLLQCPVQLEHHESGIFFSTAWICSKFFINWFIHLMLICSIEIDAKIFLESHYTKSLKHTISLYGHIQISA